VGGGRASVRPEIVLEGGGVHDEHCVIVNDHVADLVTVHPLSGRLTVDGLAVTAPTRLVQGSLYIYFVPSYGQFTPPDTTQLDGRLASRHVNRAVLVSLKPAAHVVIKNKLNVCAIRQCLSASLAIKVE